jgi:Transposase, Mutator family
MAKARKDLPAFVGKLLEEQDGDVLREGIRVLSQALMETEVAGLIGAARHERTGERTAYRNGTRLRTWDTRMGTIELGRSGRGPTFRRCCSRVRGPSMRCWPSSRRRTRTA